MKKIIITAIASVFSLALAAQAYRGDKIKTREETLNDQYTTGLFRSADGTILDLTNNTTTGGYINILDWLEGRVAGLQIYTLWNGTRIPVIRGSQARIFVDEMPWHPGFLNSLPVHDIAMIKIIKGPFAGGAGPGGGVIAIYSFRGEDADEE